MLFRDASVGRFYLHDSAYTYFTSDELHLGEISLECSRAGAAAGALWLTLQIMPLQPHRGLGPVLAAGLRAARNWHSLLQSSSYLSAFQSPELDILVYYPQSANIDAASRKLFEAAMADSEDPVYLSLLRVPSSALQPRGSTVEGSWTRVLRSVLMKPEHEHAVEHLHQRLEHFARRVAAEAP